MSESMRIGSVAIIFKGAYNPLTVYKYGNVVDDDTPGKEGDQYSYINKTASAGAALDNTLYWKLTNDASAVRAAAAAANSAAGLANEKATLADEKAGLANSAAEAASAAETAHDEAYAGAEAARDDLYTTAEGARDDLYTAAEAARDGRYATAEDGRDTAEGLRVAAEDARAAFYSGFNTALNGKASQTSLSPAYDPETTYALGDVCTYLGARYKCTTPITTPEAWTAGHWTAEDVQAVLEGHDSQLADVAHSVGILSGDVSSWGAVQQLVQDGFGQAAFPVGSQLRCTHTIYGEIIWDVVAHDHHKKPDDPAAHTMTLLMHRCIYGRPMDAIEALYYCESGLAAGTYHFSLLADYDTTYEGGKTFQFTLEQAVPAGGVVMFPWAYNVNASLTKIATYASNAATAAIESNISVIEGTGGTNLGTADGNTPNMNHAHRLRYGSNNYAESAIRQWINGSAAANAWWQPSNIFDRPPSYSNVAGFLDGFGADFVQALGVVDIATVRNTVYEVGGVKGGSYILRDKFFLPSMTELGLGNNNNIAEGSVLAYYANATQPDRIKYDIAVPATARYWWLRSPNPSYAGSVRVVSPDGALGNYSVLVGHGAAPACVIM